LETEPAILARVPMRCRATAVQQTCFGQHEQRRCTSKLLAAIAATPAQKLDHRWRQCSSHGRCRRPSGCRNFLVVERFGRNADADRTADRSACLRQQVNAIDRLADLPVCELEDESELTLSI